MELSHLLRDGLTYRDNTSERVAVFISFGKWAISESHLPFWKTLKWAPNLHLSSYAMQIASNEALSSTLITFVSLWLGTTQQYNLHSLSEHLPT